MRLLGPSASRLAPCSPPSRTLRVATRWPAAILDRGCARRPAHDQAGTKKRHSSRTKKLAPAWQGCYLRWWSRHFQEPPKFHSRRRGGMTFTRGNKAILQHARNHCDILLFEKTRRSGYYRFSGVYACAGWDYRSAPDRNGKSRQAIIFNLLPLQVDGPIQIEEEKAREASTGLRPFPELRQEAYKAAAELPSRVKGGQPKVYYERDRTVRAYVLERANGICESCEQPAPFKRKSNATPYLEPHHIRRISDGGPDHPRWVAGICPTCHREIHHGLNGQVRNSQLSVRIAAIEDHLDNKLD
ncbi:HNH endonuclease [Acidiphilium multivorum]|uniref:HNH endonuclease n=1 Tax=Acidiphilium multivorum TaxID=62140 RepID=UPI003B97E47A|nr:HNH endonuclease [Acidiphilium multivorum]